MAAPKIQIEANEGNTEKSVVKIEGDVSLVHIEEIKNKLMDEIKKTNDITIELQNIENIDLSTIQLLYSIKKTKETQNKKTILNIDLSDELQLLLKRSGCGEIFEWKN